MSVGRFLERVAIVGAAGKMGSGIAQLLLQECACLIAATGNEHSLILIDSNGAALLPLRQKLREELTRFAERQIHALRRWYAEEGALVANGEMIAAFVERALDRVVCTTAIEAAAGATLFFEAAAEELEVKAEIFRAAARCADGKCLFLSNTSSIPISALEEASGLKGRIAGFHFYNPPPAQKLIELVVPAGFSAGPFLEELTARLGKKAVRSKDVAGFIGNGHFLRELLYSCRLAEQIASDEGIELYKAICIVDRITREFLIRPMGIFQLIDYVGIGICRQVAATMRHFLNDNSLQHPLIEEQQGPFFHYEKGRPTAMSDNRPYDRCEELLGPLPKGHEEWKKLQAAEGNDQLLKCYFLELFLSNQLGCRLAQQFILESRVIAQGLVERGVAAGMEEVSTVLKLGFHHLYGPDAPWIPSEAPVMEIRRKN